MSAFRGGLAPLLGNLFSFLLFLYALLLNLVLRCSLLELNAVAPCALKRLEWSSQLQSANGIARLRSAPRTVTRRTGATWRRCEPLPRHRRRHVSRP